MKESRQPTAANDPEIRIVYHNAANRDVSRAFLYLGERNFEVANSFLSALDGDLKVLASMPGMGAVRNFDDPSLAGIRSWPLSGFRNYLTFYRVRGECLEFLRLIHGAQDIERALLSPL